MTSLEGKNLELNYPINWSYKVIGKSKENIIMCVEKVLSGREFKIKESKSHKSYISLDVELLVFNDDDRVTIFEMLKTEEHVNYVL
ncbi:MAG: DUF493 family protein [Campylobacterales bacterium]|nr:DUF493 family protein [Campylobacterales bacterium]